MNKAFKVIWNHATQSWTAVSEIARSKGKTKSAKTVLAMAVATGSAMMSSQAMAATAVAATDSTGANVQSGGADLYIQTSSADNSIAIGGAAGTTATGLVTTPATAGVGGVAIGSSTLAGEGSTAISFNANASGGNAVSIGYASTASGGASIGLGLNVKSTALETVAIGREAGAIAKQSVAIGALANASGEYSVAMGLQAGATGANGTAIGQHAAASGADSISIGTNAGVGATSGDSAVAIGRTALATGTRAVALGRTATASGARSTALGPGAETVADYGSALGNRAQVLAGANNGVAVGNSTISSADNATALGSAATASHAGSVALGNASTTTTANPTINGTVGSVTYGTFAGTTPTSVVSVGSEGAERQIVNVAAGRISATSTDAINGSQLYLVTKGTLDQFPVIYTDVDGNKLVKASDGNFYPVDTVLINGNYYPAGTTAQQVEDGIATPIAPVDTDNVVASMSDGDYVADAPKTLANVKGSLTPTYNVGDMTINTTTGLPTNTASTEYTKSQKAPDVARASVIYNNAATVGDVLNAGWNLQGNGSAVDFVKPYDTVNFVNGTGTVVNVTSDGNVSTIKVDIDTSVLTGDVTTNKNGTVSVAGNATTEGSKLANISTVVDAINNVSWNAIAGEVANSTGQVTGNASTAIKAGDTVTLNAGNNIKIEQNGATFNISTTENVSFTNANVTGNLSVNGTTTLHNLTIAANSTVNMGGNVIANVKAGSNATDAVNVGQLNSAINNATSANAWKITANDNATTATMVGSQTVSFNNGAGTTAVVDGTNVAYNVNVDNRTTEITYTNAAGETVYLLKDGTYNTQKDGKGTVVDKADIAGSQVSAILPTFNSSTLSATVNDVGETMINVNTGVITSDNNKGSVIGPVAAADNALTEAKNVLAKLPDTATEAEKKAAQDAVIVAQNAVNNAGSQIATAQNVADAINNSGFTLKSSATAEGSKDAASTGDELINPGDVVEMVAGKNMTVKQEADGKITYATKDDVEFENVTVNKTLTVASGTTITMGDNKVTNVAAGDVSENSKDAINGSQLYAVQNTFNQQMGDVNNRIDGVEQRLGDVDSMARAGIAGALATAGLPQAYLPGKNLMAIGASTFKGESGLAVSYSSISDNGSWIFKGTGSTNTQGDVGGTMAVGYQW